MNQDQETPTIHPDLSPQDASNNKWERVRNMVPQDNLPPKVDLVNLGGSDLGDQFEAEEGKNKVRNDSHTELQQECDNLQEERDALQEERDALLGLLKQAEDALKSAQALEQDTAYRHGRALQDAKQYTGKETVSAFLVLLDSVETATEQDVNLHGIQQQQRQNIQAFLSNVSQIAQNDKQREEIEAAKQDYLQLLEIFEKMQEGRKNISDLVYGIFKKLNVIAIDPVIGEAFNPDLHTAVATEKSDDASQKPNTIIRSLRKGYRLHERVMRPAMVVVSEVEA
jgi:molecular chaperone GrpE